MKYIIPGLMAIMLMAACGAPDTIVCFKAEQNATSGSDSSSDGADANADGGQGGAGGTGDAAAGDSSAVNDNGAPNPPAARTDENTVDETVTNEAAPTCGN